MSLLLPGPTPSGLPLIASATPHYPYSRDRTTSNRERRLGLALSAVESTSPSHASTKRPGSGGSNRQIRVAELPKPKRPSADLFVPAPALSPHPQSASYTPRNRNKLKRLASVDPTSTMDRVTLAGVEPKPVAVSRSRSLWTHKTGSVTIGDDARFGEPRLSRVNMLPEALAEKQRVMNVRRAKKMQQVFGSEPPQALFQVTQTDPLSGVESDHTDRFDKRASVSTLLSVSTISSQPLSRRQQRGFSTTSTFTVPTPPLTRPGTPESVLPKFERSFARHPSTTSRPFSDMFRAHTQKIAEATGTSKSTARAETTRRRRERDFRQRRMQAAKLSKFFGVSCQDLEPHISPKKNRSDVRKLEVAIEDRGGLPWDRRELCNPEMEDVIVRLRDLRSS